MLKSRLEGKTEEAEREHERAEKLDADRLTLEKSVRTMDAQILQLTEAFTLATDANNDLKEKLESNFFFF